MPLAALPTRTGARIDSLTPLRRQASSSGSEISSPSRYLVRTSSSASAAASSSWSRRRATSSARSSGIGISTSSLPSQRVGLAVDEVDVALERLGRADRELERRDLVAEASPAARRARRVGSAFSRSHLLMKKQAAVPVARPRATACSRPASTPAGGVHDEERAVGRGEALDDLGDEVRVAGRVDQRDPRPVVLERRRPRGSATRAASAPRARSRGGPSRRRRVPSRGIAPALNEELLGERRLAGAGVAGQDDAPKVGEVDALHRHRLRRSFLLQGGRPGRPGASEGSGHDSRLYSGPRCQVIPNGPRSSARRASPTPSAAPSSRRSRARSAWPRGRAAATPTPTTGCASRSRRRARSTCRPTTSSGRSTRRPAAARPSSSRRSSTRATARAAWRSSSRPRPTTATGPRPRSARCSRSPAASWPAPARSPGSSSRAA